MDPVFEEIHGHMGNAADGLARGETHAEVVEAETQSINTLTDAINLLNEQAQKQPILLSKPIHVPHDADDDGKPKYGQQSNSLRMAAAQPGATRTGIGLHRGRRRRRRRISNCFQGEWLAFNLPAEFRKSFELYFQQLSSSPHLKTSQMEGPHEPLPYHCIVGP